MFDFLYLWADVIWLPITYFSVHKKHRWCAIGFILCSMILIRLQAEIMTHIGFDNGIMGLLSSNVHTRGLYVSSFYYILFLIMARFSQSTKRVVFLAACLTIFFLIFATAAIVMLL